MGIRAELYKAYAHREGKNKALQFLVKLFGHDAEVWRTTEEGHHIKLESGTGEIKAGFGGKHNGETLKEAFSGGQSAKKPAAAKPKRIRPESTAKMISSVVGEKNLINDPDFEAARTKWADATKRKDAASKRFLEISRELKNEIEYPDDDAKSMGPQYAGLFGWYTEKGKQLKKEYDDCFAESQKAGQEAEEYGGKMDELKRQKRSDEIAEWGNPELKETTRKDFEGFTLESDVPALREKLKNGSAKVVEMSPKEYLERCAFEIFTNSTLENTVAGTEAYKVNKYADLMENGEKFPIPYLDYATENQEGRHRALAAMMNGVETIPVAIIGRQVAPADATMRETETTYDTQGKESGTKAEKQIRDKTEEFEKEAEPGSGAFYVMTRVDKKHSAAEIKMGKRLHQLFGGNLIVLSENFLRDESNPDYFWRGGLWDLKTPESNSQNAFDLRIRSGLNQIAPNSRGLIFDISACGATIEEAENKIEKALTKRSKQDLSVLIIDKDGAYKCLEYKARKAPKQSELSR